MTAACGSSRETAAPATKRVDNDEFRLSAAFPRDVPICDALSGEHVHGFYVHLDRDCRTAAVDADTRAIAVEAYYNTIFEATPAEHIAHVCRDAVRDVGVDIGTLEFPGRASARCLVGNKDGSLDIYVAAQAGQWPERGEAPEWDTPTVNYTAFLHTTEARLDEDLKTFAAVLASVRIGYSE